MNKTIVITGASSGIGKAAAIYFAQQGWNVAATMRSPEKETSLGKEKGIHLFKLDVTDNDSIAGALAAIDKQFGKIDVLVNNAGYGADGIFEFMSDKVIEDQFNTNVFGLMRVTRAIIPIFRKYKGGTIIQIASMGGRIAFPLFSIYHGTKWAVEGFTESLQFELAALNIKVKLVEPGAIKTEFYGRSRVEVSANGDKDYQRFVDKCNAVNQDAGSKGEKAEVVAKAIFKAATDGSKKLRYPVGSPAPMLLGLRKLIPDSWWFGIVRGSYKI